MVLYWYYVCFPLGCENQMAVVLNNAAMQSNLGRLVMADRRIQGASEIMLE